VKQKQETDYEGDRSGTPEGVALSDMLSQYGVSYDNAPAPTPALLAFMRGLGMSMDTAQDVNRQNQLRINQGSTMSREDLARSDRKAKTSISTDAQRRGVMSSGEMNTNLAEQAEGVAANEGRIAQRQAEAIEKSDQGYQQIRDQLGQTALEKTLGIETQQSQQRATTQAQADAIKASQDASDVAWKRQKELQEEQQRQTAQLYSGY
jgi:hypothetical protein